MEFFRYRLPVDIDRVKSNFNKVLQRRGIEIGPAAQELLFAKLVMLGNEVDTPDCPFPLICSVKSAHNHAKKIKEALGGKTGPNLADCQAILADFYQFSKWDFFTKAINKQLAADPKDPEQSSSLVPPFIPAAALKEFKMNPD